MMRTSFFSLDGETKKVNSEFHLNATNRAFQVLSDSALSPGTIETNLNKPLKAEDLPLPFKYKHRAGRYVTGQTSYDPVLDTKNWSKESLDLKSGGLPKLTLSSAIYVSDKKPKFRTREGRLRHVTMGHRLFGEGIPTELELEEKIKAADLVDQRSDRHVNRPSID